MIARREESQIVSNAVRIIGMSIPNEEDVFVLVQDVPPAPAHVIGDIDEHDVRISGPTSTNVQKVYFNPTFNVLVISTTTD